MKMAATTSDVKAIWQEFHQQLRGFIVQRVNNPADADDILQEVFVRIYQRLTTVQESDRLQSWIFTITRNATTFVGDGERALRDLATVMREVLVR
jgi:RNA polymerase sigma-70 factor, ECF subfamily